MSHVALKRVLTTIGLAGVAWLVVVFVSRSAALTEAKRTIAAQKEENAAIVEGVYRLARERIKAESLKVVQAERALARERAKSAKVLDSANTATLRNVAVLQDAAATVPQLRTALSSQIATTDALAQQFREYLQSDSSYHRVIEAERDSVYSLLTLADSTIRVKNDAIAAYKDAATCRVLWFRCPTRTQSFVAGGIATLGIVLAIR